MTKNEYLYLKELLNEPLYKLIANESYQEIEDIFIKIQKIPSFPKAFNFVNIHHIQDQVLTDKEMHFLNEIIPYVSSRILDNPRAMQQFLSQTLIVYNNLLEKSFRKTITPLKENQTWIKTPLDKMDIDIFT